MTDDVSLYSSFESGNAWYAFWAAGKTTTGDKEEQELCVYFKDKSGNYIKDLHRHGNLERYSYREDMLFTTGLMSGASQDELNHLEEIFKWFVGDVNEYYQGECRG